MLKYAYIPAPLRKLQEMEGQDILDSEVIRLLREAIPTGSHCLAGCSECCEPVPFSQWEWDQVPPELRKVATVRQGYAIVPVPPGTPRHVFRKGFPVFEIMRLNSDGRYNLACPFESEKGCIIYDHRPILCRLFAAVKDPRLTCSHGVRTWPLLEAEVGMAIMAMADVFRRGNP